MSTPRRLRSVPDAPPLFGIGVRVSRVNGRSGERFLSPEIQITAARRAIEAAGGLVDVTAGEQGVFYDLDVSGAIAPGDRPGLGQALDLVRAGHLQGVAVYDLSRFSRDTAGGLRALEEVAAVGGQVLSASELIDIDSPAGLFSTTVQLAAHKLRRDEASRGWKATHQRRFEMGLNHGKVPYGYLNRDGGAAVDPILGPAITVAFADYAAGGVSQKALAERLGHLRGKPMRQGVISQLLRNRFYVGEVSYIDQVGPGVHTAPVDEETFAAVQRRLLLERPSGPHARIPRSPVVGLVFCAVCHGPLYRQGAGQRGGRPRPNVMVCGGLNARTCLGIGNPNAAEIEQAVKDLALEVARQLQDETPARVQRASKATRARAELKRLEAEKIELLNAIGRLGVSHARNVMDDLAYGEAVKQLRADLDMVESQLLQVQVAEEGVSQSLEQLRSAVVRIEQLWGVMEPAEQRAALRQFVPRVEVRRAAYRGEPVAERLVLPE